MADVLATYVRVYDYKTGGNIKVENIPKTILGYEALEEYLQKELGEIEKQIQKSSFLEL